MKLAPGDKSTLQQKMENKRIIERSKIDITEGTHIYRKITGQNGNTCYWRMHTYTEIERMKMECYNWKAIISGF